MSVNAGISARLVERAGPGSWRVEVRWTTECQGVGAEGGTFQGLLFLVDLDTGERSSLGLTSGPGEETHSVTSRAQPRRIRFELEISCYDNDNLHGSGVTTVSTDTILIPGRNGDLGDGTGSGGGGGGGGGSGGGGDASAPLGSGGCEPVILGTPTADELEGGNPGEVIFGLGANDRLKGRGGNDCLIGGPGSDRLLGGPGLDRLTGGPGRDRLFGNGGRNAYDAGPGKDFVDAVNGRAETVRCGAGRDRARVDVKDRVRGCERVRRVER